MKNIRLIIYLFNVNSYIKPAVFFDFKGEVLFIFTD